MGFCDRPLLPKGFNKAPGSLPALREKGEELSARPMLWRQGKKKGLNVGNFFRRKSPDLNRHKGNAEKKKESH